MDKCPFCGADTRPGDNFCLNCGNRLLPTTPAPSPQQAQPGIGDATIAATDGWIAAPDQGTTPAGNWGDDNAQTLVGPSDLATVQSEAPTTAAGSQDNNIEQPARFILRSDSGEVLQEYPLNKAEITIGRAPNSDILLSKDKLTSRRHATVQYEQGKYLLRDERSANGTFVNGQQLEDMAPYELHEGDHIGIGEHELIFRTFNSPTQASVEDLPTMSVKYEAPNEMTYRTREDELATIATAGDEYGTHSSLTAEPAAEPTPEPAQQPDPVAVGVSDSVAEPSAPAAAPSVPVAAAFASLTPVTQEKSSAPVSESSFKPSYSAPSSMTSDSGINFNRLTSIPQPALPDISPLVAALSALDGQVNSLREQLNTTQEGLRNHEAELAQSSNQLRAGVRRVSDRMDNTIADVARSREALAWSELLQLMEDVMNNPRDIEYVTKLARKARELNKVFQMHQNVLNTMAECNSLLRSMIGE